MEGTKTYAMYVHYNIVVRSHNVSTSSARYHFTLKTALLWLLATIMYT